MIGGSVSQLYSSTRVPIPIAHVVTLTVGRCPVCRWTWAVLANGFANRSARSTGRQILPNRFILVICYRVRHMSYRRVRCV